MVVFAVLLSGRATAIELPPGPGRSLVYGKCRTCHDLQYLVDSAGVDEATWDGLLDDMEGFGCEFTAEQRKTLLRYLATYLGPNPPPPPTTTAEATGHVDGEAIFRDQCVSCHQENGRGVPGDFPPLDGNPDLFRDRLLPAYVVLFGLEGEIRVGDETYNGIMPSFAHLSDAEVAAVVNYIRHAWSNAAVARPEFRLTADDVAALRAKTLTPEAVHVYRQLHLTGATP